MYEEEIIFERTFLLGLAWFEEFKTCTKNSLLFGNYVIADGRFEVIFIIRNSFEKPYALRGSFNAILSAATSHQLQPCTVISS
jgi:hypothetical protein